MALFRDADYDNISQLVLDRLFEEGYNKNMVPSKSATIVTIEFVIQNIAQVSEISASFTLDLLFRSPKTQNTIEVFLVKFGMIQDSALIIFPLACKTLRWAIKW